MSQPTKFKIWYNHQIPGPSYEQEVPNPEIGQAILDAIYQVALYQFNNRMIPDYCNAGGIVYLDEDGDWVDYDTEDWATEDGVDMGDPDNCCIICGKCAVVDTGWGWECTACGSSDVAVGCVRPEDGAA